MIFLARGLPVLAEAALRPCRARLYVAVETLVWPRMGQGGIRLASKWHLRLTLG